MLLAFDMLVFEAFFYEMQNSNLGDLFLVSLDKQPHASCMMLAQTLAQSINERITSMQPLGLMKMQYTK